MNIELRNLKINLAFSEETTMFKADVYVNGKKCAYAENDGHGGSTFISPHTGMKSTLEMAEAYCATLPDIVVTPTFSYKMNLEAFIDDLVEKAVQKKEEAAFNKKRDKAMLSGIVASNKPNSFSIIGYKGHTIASILQSELGRQTLKAKIASLKAEGYKILNTNIPSEILG